eukprot:TRINITY_DN106098_c0_g1_i1.p1 TRINITY_DN106098_c0_g1~~TRINITY_DN106098_c0_g1_i1.p1  ORF type:complete len:181 (+),score=17.96 TRINITY_DN106098_c0_g1_i1:42-584(+)
MAKILLGYFAAFGAATVRTHGSTHGFESEDSPAKSCGRLDFDGTSLPPSEWRVQIYVPFTEWSIYGGNIHRTTRDMALLLRNALMRGRGHIEGDRGCFCAFVVAVLVRVTADLSYGLRDREAHWDLEHVAAHDMLALYAHLIKRTFDGPLYTSWPVEEAFARTFRTFKTWGSAKHGSAGQ